mgnify:CR=1 FL=1
MFVSLEEVHVFKYFFFSGQSTANTSLSLTSRRYLASQSILSLSPLNTYHSKEKSSASKLPRWKILRVDVLQIFHGERICFRQYTLRTVILVLSINILEINGVLTWHHATSIPSARSSSTVFISDSAKAVTRV